MRPDSDLPSFDIRRQKVPKCLFGIGGTARASFYIYNTLEEVEAFGRTLKKVKAFFKVEEKAVMLSSLLSR